MTAEASRGHAGAAGSGAAPMRCRACGGRLELSLG